MSAMSADADAPAMAMSIAPELGWMDTIIQHIQHNPLSMSLIAICGVVVLWSVVAEYFFRKKRKTDNLPFTG